MSTKRPRCVALDSDGRQCRKRSTDTVDYFGNPEHYPYTGPEPQWVRAPLCAGHQLKPRRKP